MTTTLPLHYTTQAAQRIVSLIETCNSIKLRVTLHWATGDIAAPVYEVVDIDGDNRRAYVKTHADSKVFCVPFEDIYLMDTTESDRQAEEVAEYDGWLGVLDAVRHPERVDGWDESDIADDIPAREQGSTEEISARWEATSDNYKASQPYHNDLYSF